MRPKSTNVDLQGNSPLPPETVKLLNWPKPNNDNDNLKKDPAFIESELKPLKTDDNLSPQSETKVPIEEQMVKLLLDVPGINDPNNFRKSVQQDTEKPDRDWAKKEKKYRQIFV